MSELLVDEGGYERGCACYDPRDGGKAIKVPKEITVRVREVYGHAKYYPECDDAKVFASIAGTTTLTEQTLRRIMKLGYKVKTLSQTNNFIEGEMK